MQKIRAKIEPRAIFAPLFADDVARFCVVVAHRRSGKTVAAIQRLIHGALSCSRPNARFAFIAPFRHQAKNVAWDYLKRMTAGFPNTQVNEAELRVDLFNNARIQIFGADNPDALRGTYLDGAALDEYAQMDPSTWDQVVRPMLSDRRGWALFIGTPMGRNAFYDLYADGHRRGWRRWLFKASETGLIDAEELAAARADMSPEAYEQEYELSWTAAVRGAYYGSLMEQAEADGRITDLPILPTAWTVTAWDLGVRDATAIWVVQMDGPWFNCIDYIESAGVGLDWYIDKLKAKGYRYDLHVAPQDINVSELGTGRTRLEIARGLGIDFTVCRQHRVDDGIQAVRTLIPRMRFDKVRCARGIQALQLYRAEWDPRLSALRSNPLHDQYSHGADAARYLAMADLTPRHGTYDDPRISPNTGQAYNRATDGYHRGAR